MIAAVLSAIAYIAPLLAFIALAAALFVVAAAAGAALVLLDEEHDEARRRSSEPIYWRQPRGRR